MAKKNNLGYRVLRFILNPIFRIYYNPKIYNKEVIPKDGPILVCGNHIHLMDQCLPVLATKRTLTYMAKKEYYDNKKVRWFFQMAGCIFVDRSKKDNQAVEAALEVLHNNGAIGLFPEGTRNKTELFLQPFKFGAVSMAQKTGATIVPFGITGDYKFRSKNLTARFGTPFKIGDMTLEEANDKLFNEVKSLMEENLKEENK